MATVNAYQREFQRLFSRKPYSVASAGFMGAFFGRANGIDQTIFSPNNVDIVIPIQKSSGMQRARFVQRGTDANQKDHKGKVQDKWSELEMKFPLIEEVGYISSDQLDRRMASEVPDVMNGQSLSRQQRKSLMYQSLSFELAKEVFNTHAYAASRSILYGYQPGVLDTTDADKQYSWQRNANSIVDLTGSEWNTGTPTIATDISTGCDYVRKNGKKIPDVLMLSADMFAAMVRDTETKTLAENRRYEFTKIGSSEAMNSLLPAKYKRITDSGFAFVGIYTAIDSGDQLYSFIYKGFYNLDDGSQTPVDIMPSGTAMVCSYEAETRRYFGPSDGFEPNAVDMMWMQSELGFNPSTPIVDMDLKRLAGDGGVFDPRGLYAYVDGSRKTREYGVQSAPLYVPVDIDAYYTMTDGIA